MAKPVHLKALAGDIRPCRDNSKIEAMANIELLTELPEAPNWLPNHFSVTSWDTTGRLLITNKLLASVDLQMFGQLCALEGKIIQLYTAGESPNASQIASLTGMYLQFGMSPMSRQKILTPKEKPADNKFAKNGTRNKQ